MRKYRAVTLVQLLVVLAIIGILAAILVPAIARARTSALTASCASNLCQIGKALHTYANDWDGYAPPFTAAAVRGPEHDENFDGMTHDEIVDKILRERKPTTAKLRRAYEPYIKNDQIWYCPAEPLPGKRANIAAKATIIA